MISSISSGLSVTWFSRCTTFLAPIEKKRNWKSQGIDRRNKWEPRWHGLWSHVFKWQLSATYNCIWNLLGCSWQRCPCREVWPCDSLVGGKGNSCSFCLVKDHVPQRSSVLFLSYLTEASSGEALGSGKPWIQGVWLLCEEGLPLQHYEELFYEQTFICFVHLYLLTLRNLLVITEYSH